MHARLFLVRLNRPDRALAESIAERWAAAAATLPGFVDVTFFGSTESRECGYFSLWETERQALDAHFELGPQLYEALDEVAAGEPDVRVYEVFEPRR